MSILKRRITVVVSKELQKDLKSNVIKDGYGFRGKSKWVSEAIFSLLKVKNFPELVHYNYDMARQLTEMEVVTVDHLLAKQIDEAITKIRQNYPLLEGVKSCIVRTAIIQRILRK